VKVVLVAKDKAGALPVRMENRPLHVEYLKGSPEVEQAGPILNADGDMCGSVIILNVEDMADAEAWAKADPYAKAGLFESVELLPWNRVIET